MSPNAFALNLNSKRIRYIFTDLLIIGFICLLPTITHLTSVPFYLFEPMRFAMVLAIIFTNRNNSLLIAATLPLISILISSHPDLTKGLLISIELLLNIVLFYYLTMRLNTIIIAMFVSTLISKLLYYTSKLFFIKVGFISGELISTPLWIQYIVVVGLSIFASVLFRKKEVK